MEIEYVSAPLEFDFVVGGGAAPTGDAEMAEAGVLGLGAEAPGAGGEGGEQQPPAPTDFQRILQRFGTVENLLGTAEPADGEEGEEGGAGTGALALLGVVHLAGGRCVEQR